jgi:hypothetical protein
LSAFAWEGGFDARQAASAGSGQPTTSHKARAAVKDLAGGALREAKDLDRPLPPPWRAHGQHELVCLPSVLIRAACVERYRLDGRMLGRIKPLLRQGPMQLCGSSQLMVPRGGRSASQTFLPPPWRVHDDLLCSSVLLRASVFTRHVITGKAFNARGGGNEHRLLTDRIRPLAAGGHSSSWCRVPYADRPLPPPPCSKGSSADMNIQRFVA